MARLDVTGIDDQLLEWFAHRAHRLGISEGDLAKSLIEREGRSEQTWQNLEDSSRRVRDRLRRLSLYEGAKPISKVSDR